MHNVLIANTRKVLIEMRRYLPNTLSIIFTFYIIFLMFFLGIQLVGSPDAAAQNIQYLIVSVVLWFLALMAMQSIGHEITQEATRGTLEQLYMSPIATRWILLSRMLGTMLVNVVIMTVMLALVMLTAQQWLTLDIFTLTPLFLLTITGMLGVGFMVASLALVYKQIEAILQIGQFVFLGLVATPIAVSPFLEVAPIVRGASMIRDAMMHGAAWHDFPPFAWTLLAFNAVLYLGFGFLVYAWAERWAMRLGLLGQY